ncbi:MAG TPA: HDOD domain-containing protein [Spirochaetales bacterium]|nr:HDOD domain-containing protein [Spirochaetales bacterium]
MDTYASRLSRLPVNPSIAAKVLKMADSQDVSFGALEEIIMADPGLTARILRIANSALYARQTKVTRLQTAFTLLGTKTIRNLVILATGSSLFRRDLSSSFYAYFWTHSLATAFLARDLAARCGFPQHAEECFVAGLLHDVGQVAFLLANPEEYDALVLKARLEGTCISDLEARTYGTDHKKVGAEVLASWSFPAVYVDAALEHGSPNVASASKQVVASVTAADLVAANWAREPDPPRQLSGLDHFLAYLRLGADELDAWQAETRIRLEKDPFYLGCRELLTEG